MKTNMKKYGSERSAEKIIERLRQADAEITTFHNLQKNSDGAIAKQQDRASFLLSAGRATGLYEALSIVASYASDEIRELSSLQAWQWATDEQKSRQSK